MYSYRPPRFRNIVLLAIVLALLAPGAAQAQPPPNTVYLPTILHDDTCRQVKEFVFFAPTGGIYYRIVADNQACPVVAYERVWYTDGAGVSQYSPAFAMSAGPIYYRAARWQNETRHYIEFAGMNFHVIAWDWPVPEPPQ